MASPNPRYVAGNYISLGLAILGCLGWVACVIAGVHPSEPVVALLAGIAILAAAFLLSWGVEVAEMDLPPALAVSILALIAVLPEYAVDATFAWKAAHDPKQASYAIANMTGGNRLLLGLGWSTLVGLAWMRFGHPGIRLPKSASTDIAILFLASLYAIVPVVRGTLTLMDTAVLMSMYAVYVVAVTRVTTEHEEHDLVGPAALFGTLKKVPRRVAVAGLFLWAAAVIFLAAEPFAEALIHTGLGWGIDEFLLVQWVAPLASEAPEFVVASLLVLRGNIATGMMALVSSKVNQWTVLIGTLPVVTSISGGEVRYLPLDARQQEEVLLTAAQSMFGVAILANRFLSRGQAMLLAGLFLGQMVLTHARIHFTWAYLIASVLILLRSKASRDGLVSSYGVLWRALRGKAA